MNWICIFDPQNTKILLDPVRETTNNVMNQLSKDIVRMEKKLDAFRKFIDEQTNSENGFYCPTCNIPLRTSKVSRSGRYTFFVQQCPRCKKHFTNREDAHFDPIVLENIELKKQLTKIRNLIN